MCARIPVVCCCRRPRRDACWSSVTACSLLLHARLVVGILLSGFLLLHLPVLRLLLLPVLLLLLLL